MGKRDTFIGRNKVVDIVLEETRRGDIPTDLKERKTSRIYKENPILNNNNK